MRALLRPILRPLLAKVIVFAAPTERILAATPSPARTGWWRGFTSTRVLGTVYEDVRRERRLKKHKKMIRLGLKKRKKKKKKSTIWAEPCKAEQMRDKDHTRPIISPYADAQTWPRLRGERDRVYAAKALNTSLVHFGQLNSMFRRE